MDQFLLVKKEKVPLDGVTSEHVSLSTHALDIKHGEYEIVFNFIFNSEKYTITIPLSLKDSQDSVAEIDYSQSSTDARFALQLMIELADFDELTQENISDAIKKINPEYVDRKHVREKWHRFGIPSIVLLAMISFMLLYLFVFPSLYSAAYVAKVNSKHINGVDISAIVDDGNKLKQDDFFAKVYDRYVEAKITDLEVEQEGLLLESQRLAESTKSYEIYKQGRILDLQTSIKALEFELTGLDLEFKRAQKNAIRLSKAKVSEVQVEEARVLAEVLENKTQSKTQELARIKQELINAQKGIFISSRDPKDSTYNPFEEKKVLDGRLADINDSIEQWSLRRKLLSWCDCVFDERFFTDQYGGKIHLIEDNHYAVFSAKDDQVFSLISKKVQVGNHQGVVVGAVSSSIFNEQFRGIDPKWLIGPLSDKKSLVIVRLDTPYDSDSVGQVLKMSIDKIGANSV